MSTSTWNVKIHFPFLLVSPFLPPPLTDGLVEASEAAVDGAILRAELAANPGPLLALLEDLSDGALRSVAQLALHNVALKLALELQAPCLPGEADRTEAAVSAVAQRLATADLTALVTRLREKAPAGFVDGLCLRHLVENDGAEAILEELGEPGVSGGEGWASHGLHLF